jgi:hypothetical protein
VDNTPRPRANARDCTRGPGRKLRASLYTRKRLFFSLQGTRRLLPV